MSDLVLVPAFVGLAMMLLAVFRSSESSHRIFWIGAAVTTISAFFIGLPRGWRSGLGGSTCVVAAIVFTAYLYTPFLNIRGKIRTFYSDRRQPYGAGVTTPKAWWQLLLAVAIFMYPVFAFATGRGGPGPTTVSAGVAIAAGISFGYRDRFLHNSIAAGQRVQFALVSIITLGVFPICYLGAYYASQRRIAKHEAYGRHSHRRT
ncbi:hypothetical protein OS122_28675 [Mycolicibacterium mucogenicum]|uniref:hypothetical protein n=1 Tax=Mycolicibacterium mucogenicum TaxID=56689 RepID=UPI00226AA9A8|nr:hypothetical protein [Mycolicibacterium mucogenicum]MCX8564862.1 hypothetical protein [Mycolicibacterium mucogenicum]